MKDTREVKIDVCYSHKDTFLETIYRSYVFNEYLCFPAKTCNMKGCTEDAFYTLIGVRIPNCSGPLEGVQAKKHRAIIELFTEAKKILDNGPAAERLCFYLKTRLLCSERRSLLAEKLLGKMSRLVLDKLKIDPDISLSDTDKHRILKELRLYPEDYME